MTCSDKRGLARGFRPEDLDDPAARDAADAERVVEAHRPGGDRLGSRVDGILLAEAHDRALAELLLDLADGHLDGLETFAVVAFFYWRHANGSSLENMVESWRRMAVATRQCAGE